MKERDVFPGVPAYMKPKKLTKEKAAEIKKLLHEGKTPNELALLYEVSASNIRCIRRGEIWRD